MRSGAEVRAAAAVLLLAAAGFVRGVGAETVPWTSLRGAGETGSAADAASGVELLPDQPFPAIGVCADADNTGGRSVSWIAGLGLSR